MLRTVQGKVSDAVYQEGRAAFLEFNPKFDFNTPSKAATPIQRFPRTVPELASLAQGLTLIDNRVQGEYRARLLHFLVEGQKAIEAGFTKPDQILEGITGYEQLSEVARAAGRRDPAGFFDIVTHDIPLSPHRQVLQPYLLMNLAIGMSSADKPER
jgi:hypothetical protein